MWATLTNIRKSIMAIIKVKRPNKFVAQWTQDGENYQGSAAHFKEYVIDDETGEIITKIDLPPEDVLASGFPLMEFMTQLQVETLEEISYQTKLATALAEQVEALGEVPVEVVRDVYTPPVVTLPTLEEQQTQLESELEDIKVKLATIRAELYPEVDDI